MAHIMALPTTATDTASGWLTFPSAPLGMRNIWNHSIEQKKKYPTARTLGKVFILLK